MTPFFRRRADPPEAPAPAAPHAPAVAEPASTLYVTGDARRDTDRIRLLVDSLREVSSATEPDELLVRMVDRAVKLVGAERGLLFTIDAEGRAALRVARSATGRDLPRDAAFSTHVVASVLRDGVSVCERIDDASGFDPSRSMIDLGLGAVMGVPLVSQEKRLGVLCVDARPGRGFSKADLRFFEAFADMLAIVWTNRQALEKRLEAERMAQDIEVARRIQANLLPERPLVVEGYSMCGRVLPAAETGGDYFDFFATRDDKLAIAVGDVSGHGIGSALIMAGARAYLRGFCQSSSSPGQILRRVNRSLGGDIADDMFMSMFLCVIDPRTREFRYANAGHTRPVLLHGDTQEAEDYRTTGMALGVAGDADYEERGPFVLRPGDTVVMFSDGLTELRRDDEQYGRQRVVESIRRHGRGTAEAVIAGVFQDALEWAQGTDHHPDDVTVAVLRADS